ncbi:hypothetical protein IWQ56_004189, partial [Coemansia nantahalensis]
LLRKIPVAGVTVEVVRQNSTIIYRLPGNMPVSSLTPEQRAKVMSEIQRIRNASAPTTPTPPGRPPAARTAPTTPRPAGERRPLPPRSPAPVRHSRPAPALPSIAPRQPAPLAANSGASGLHSAPVAGRFLASSPHGAVRPRGPPPAAPRTPPSTLAPRRQQPGTLPSPGPAQKSALERLYQSAYLRLLRGPAEALRKLVPPVELSSLVSAPTDGATSQDMLLLILKALTKAQAAQLARMFDQETRREPISQPPSGAASPTGSYGSGAEPDGIPGSPASGAATPTKRRKYNKTGKYSVKKRATWSLGSPDAGSPAPHDRPPLPLPQGVVVHPGAWRATAAPLVERPKTPALAKHEAEISRRFRDALAMDRQMVENPDWRTPFDGVRDVIQRLLPYHVYQYHDRDIDAASAREEQRIQASAPGLGARMAMLQQRYRALLTREGSDSHYSVDHIQIESRRIDAAHAELDQLQDMRLERDIAAMGARLPGQSQ